MNPQGDESMVDDEKIIVFDNNFENNFENKLDEEDVLCMAFVDYFQRKMICLISILIVGAILLVFIYTASR